MTRLLRRTAQVICALLALSTVLFGLLCWQIDRYGRRDDRQEADAIVILGALVTPAGQPGSDLTSRTYHGVDLYNAGLAPRLICAGGYAGDPLSAAAVARRFAISLGVPAENVLLADGALTTAGEARVTAELMRSNGWSSILLVSHPLHLYRARWSFRRHGVIVHGSPTTTETERIYLPLRVALLVREAGGLIVTVLEDWGIVTGPLPRWRPLI